MYSHIKVSHGVNPSFLILNVVLPFLQEVPFSKSEPSSYFQKRLFYDRNDTTWYVDPASESRVNELRLNRLEDAGGSFLLRPGTTSGSPRHLNLWDSTGDPSQANGGTGITWGQRGDNNPYYLI